MISKDSGRAQRVTNNITSALNAVATIRSLFNAGATSFSSFTRAENMVIKLIGIPTADIKIGNKRASRLVANATAPITSAAHVLSAHEPNKSAPIPATSPTLSPTLSAITAGFRGSSSGIPCSTLPTRSAPTSAALVKIPPLTRANRAMEEPPSPNPAMTSIKICLSIPGSNASRTR